MTKINNQSKSLFNIAAVEDISLESAASYSGGIKVYTGANFTGQVRTPPGVADLSQVDGGFFNNKISSIKNDTNKRWAFYKKANFTGERFTLQPGSSMKSFATGFNNTITSYRSVPNVDVDIDGGQ